MPPTRPSASPRAIDVAFGRALRRCREDRGISQEQLGHEADSGRTFISQLERGEKGASLKTLFRLAAQLKIAPSEIVRRMEQQLGRK